MPLGVRSPHGVRRRGGGGAGKTLGGGGGGGGVTAFVFVFSPLAQGWLFLMQSWINKH